MLKLSWPEKITNEEVLQRMDEKRTLISILRARILRYFGHLLRLNNVYRTLLEGYIDGMRGRGRPRMSWHGNIKEWTGRNINRQQERQWTEKSGGLLSHPTLKDKEHEEEAEYKNYLQYLS